MARFPVFSSPFLLGFDQLERMLDALARNGNEPYPPYDIGHINEKTIRITLALAGFVKGDLNITLEGGQLIIRGKQKEGSKKEFLHQGIATRQFLRKFVLVDGMKVKAAYFENGLLIIELVRPEPERTWSSHNRLYMKGKKRTWSGCLQHSLC